MAGVFRERYPLLYYYFSLFILANGLDLEQIGGIVKNAVASNPALGDEITAALSDGSICWREVLNDAELGEIYPADSEALALDYARQMLGVPATGC